MIGDPLRRLWMRLRGKTPVINGSCNRCGQCCRGIHLKLGGRWLRRESDFRKALEHFPRYAIFEPIGHDSAGLLRFACTRLGADGLCTCYEDRPSVCRKYPSAAMFYAGGELIPGCGFRLCATRSFEGVLRREVRRRNRGKGPVVDENLGELSRKG